MSIIEKPNQPAQQYSLAGVSLAAQLSKFNSNITVEPRRAKRQKA